MVATRAHPWRVSAPSRARATAVLRACRRRALDEYVRYVEERIVGEWRARLARLEIGDLRSGGAIGRGRT